MKKLTLLSMVLLALWFAIQSVREQNQQTAKEIETLLLSESQQPSESLNYIMTQVADKAELSSGIIDRRIDEAALPESEKWIANALGHDKNGRAFFRFMKASEPYSQIPGGRLYVDRFVSDLHKDKTAATNQITTMLERLSDDRYFPTRANLIYRLGQSPEISPILAPLARKEMIRVAVEERPESLNNSTTEADLSEASLEGEKVAAVLKDQIIVIQGSSDPQDIVDATVDAISNQPNTKLRLALADQLVSMAPQLQKKFEEKLFDDKVELPRLVSSQSVEIPITGGGQKPSLSNPIKTEIDSLSD